MNLAKKRNRIKQNKQYSCPLNRLGCGLRAFVCPNQCITHDCNSLTRVSLKQYIRDNTYCLNEQGRTKIKWLISILKKTKREKQRDPEEFMSEIELKEVIEL